MKRSELKNIIKELVEASYVDSSSTEIGKTKIDPQTGVKSTLKSIDPETGKFSWDVEYDVDPKFLYDKLDQLVDYLRKAPKDSELAQYRDILKNLKNRTARVINQSK
jgi:hypothetical protein